MAEETDVNATKKRSREGDEEEENNGDDQDHLSKVVKTNSKEEEKGNHNNSEEDCSADKGDEGKEESSSDDPATPHFTLDRIGDVPSDSNTASSTNPGSLSNPDHSNPGFSSNPGHSNPWEVPETPSTATATIAALPEPTIIEEKDHVSAAFVGRVIGKGGEMIRDLQARAGCRVDVDQNVPEGAPRVITYRGTRAKVDFAKRLVKMLCEEGRRDIDLPLGEASQKHILVAANVIGKIIGRGGEMIRELQNKSQAKIQVHHTATEDMDPNQRKVTVTGTPISVSKAEEMIHFLTTNPAMDAMTALHMLIEEKAQGRSNWGSGPPYPNMPNGGIGMLGTAYGAQQGYPQQQYAGYYGQQQTVYAGGAAYGQQTATAAATPVSGYYGQAAPFPAVGGMEEVEIVPCPRMFMGRVIGQKGATINDLQKRSGCDIQINQDVPQGQDCQITVKGSRQGIELAKQMLKEVIEMGPGHSYAGGRQQQSYGQQQQYAPQQQVAYPQQAAAASTGYAQHYQQYQQQAYGQQAAVAYGQQQPQQQYTQAAYGAYSAASLYPMAGPSVVVQESQWKTATAGDGQVYYYNEKTGESQWEKPPGMP
mmetsp:Transcript_3623/g.5391  ORF Transcript_3623/g.5391 Transcript_3623/m.5391 type:complete len:593 (-) Transcript_3623:758-2536(-)|eukprot:CAMPEP_0172417292 /NCGR_PEP_ID=MMETSP1064-20121228/3815_1 /TAXON_ID=202472 /ORGANISM="Aulacoseira subarctica , Strain CCAP 1002/5" /LENGTH=592 /DNA_ID=CAMNT_0013155533 /DNA_START=71 /DNA_END=1849 /DNA_ORIENTATION=-